MILVAIAVGGFSVYCILDFASMARNSHTQGLLRDMNAIMSDVEKLPPGIAGAEELLRRLRKVDPGLAPAECKQALRDYIGALEGSLEAMKGARHHAV
jgi:hypothetical protein